MPRFFSSAKSKKLALNGTMLCIDPSSGGVTKGGQKGVSGWALFEAGELKESGTIGFEGSKLTFERVKEVGKKFSHIFDKVDILVIEEIKGAKAQKSLIQACGAIIAAVEWDSVFEINVRTWQSIANKLGGWIKTDEDDAIYLGYAALAIAKGYHSGLAEKAKLEILEQTKELMDEECNQETKTGSEGSTETSRGCKSKRGIKKKRGSQSRKKSSCRRDRTR